MAVGTPKSASSISPDVFPSLHTCFKLDNEIRLYDIKFYPFETPNNEQIFAIVGDQNVYVCRINEGADPPFDILRWFKDLHPDPSFNSLIWSKHPVSQKPLVCVAGHKPKQVQILDVETGSRIRTLVGHGRGINDLAISPLSSSLLASAAEDYTIRLWNLEAKYENQPCVALFAGEGHKMPILAITFHPNGCWLLSGGIDTAVCLWAVPGLQDLERHGHDADVHHDPKTIYYPHFHSTEVHDNYVDCLTFYGDLIISRSASDPNSKAKTNEILLWKIDGFDSRATPPTEPPIPSPGICTRSSFPHASTSKGFQRLLTFDINDTDRFYQRFSLLHHPGSRPILAMGNQKSKYLFWDLQKLEEGHEAGEDMKPRRKKGGRKPKSAVNAENLTRLSELRRDTSELSGSMVTPDASSTSFSTRVAERKFDLGDPFYPLPAHRSVVGNTSLSARDHFGTTQIAWSPNGLWMIGVGDYGMMCFFRRDASAA